MIVGRIIGWIFLLAAIAVFCWDLVAIIITGNLTFTPLGAIWAKIDSTSLQLLQAGVERHVAPWLWDQIIQPILEAPAALDFFVVGAIFALLFRRRRKKSKSSDG